MRLGVETGDGVMITTKREYATGTKKRKIVRYKKLETKQKFMYSYHFAPVKVLLVSSIVNLSSYKSFIALPVLPPNINIESSYTALT